MLIVPQVQISEEDYVLISSGIPQKMIPPQPIVEDEEKELGTLEILEKNLGQIVQLADQGSSISLYDLRSHAHFVFSRCSYAAAQPPSQGAQAGNP